MTTTIRLNLFATLDKYIPENAANYPISPGVSVRELIRDIGIPEKDVKLVFVNNVRSTLSTPLDGGEKVAIFPPVGGG